MDHCVTGMETRECIQRRVSSAVCHADGGVVRRRKKPTQCCPVLQSSGAECAVSSGVSANDDRLFIPHGCEGRVLAAGADYGIVRFSLAWQCLSSGFRSGTDRTVPVCRKCCWPGPGALCDRLFFDLAAGTPLPLRHCHSACISKARAVSSLCGSNGHQCRPGDKHPFQRALQSLGRPAGYGKAGRSRQRDRLSSGQGNHPARCTADIPQRFGPFRWCCRYCRSLSALADRD